MRIYNRKEPLLTQDRPGVRSLLKTMPAHWVLLSWVLLLSFQAACLFGKKDKGPQYPTAPVQIVLLPFNIPDGRDDLRWASIAAAVAMAKDLENAQDLEVVPLWVGFPAAVQARAGSRALTSETAAFVASRVSAQWTALGTILPSENKLSVQLDFIPAKPSLIAFRYENETSLDSIGNQLSSAYEQFLRYLIARPIKKKGLFAVEPYREMARAIDQEYGWFASASPGSADKAVAELAREDNRLARLLFDPDVYPQQISGSTGTPRPTATPQPTKPQPAPAAPTTATAPEPDQTAPTKGKVQAATRTATPPPQEREEEVKKRAPPPVPPTQSKPDRAPQHAQAPETSSRNTKERVSTQLPTPSPPPASASASQRPPARPPSKPITSNSTPAPAVTFVQVFATQSQAGAESKVVALTDRGYQATVQQVQIPDRGTWYRVRLKIEGSREKAVTIANALVTQGVIEEYWILKE